MAGAPVPLEPLALPADALTFGRTYWWEGLFMMLRAFFPAIVVTALLFAACGGGASSATPTPGVTELTETQPPSPTTRSGVATGSVQGGKTLRTAGGKLEVTGNGSSPLELTLRELAKEPAPAPQGWQIVTPIFEITATVPGSGPVTDLPDSLDLRFRSADSLATVISFDGKRWQLVPSDLADGYVGATINHLSVYAAAKPAFARLRPGPTATPTPPPASNTPATPGTPTATVTAATPTISIDTARIRLGDAIDKYTGTLAKVTNAASYSTEQGTSLPPSLEAVLADADLVGSVYSGVYNGVNQVFAAQAPAGRTGSLVLLMEPKTEFPSSASEAQRMLASYFPDAAGLQYVAVQQSTNAYTFQASTGSFYVLGFVRYEGVPVAFLSVGSGVYIGAAVKAKQ